MGQRGLVARESVRMVAGKVPAGATLNQTNQTPITSHRQRRVRSAGGNWEKNTGFVRPFNGKRVLTNMGGNKEEGKIILIIV